MQRIGEALQRSQRPGGKVSNYKTTSRWLQLNFDAYTPAGVEYIRCSTPAGVAEEYRHFSPNAIRGYSYSTAVAVFDVTVFYEIFYIIDNQYLIKKPLHLLISCLCKG